MPKGLHWRLRKLLPDPDPMYGILYQPIRRDSWKVRLPRDVSGTVLRAEKNRLLRTWPEPPNIKVRQKGSTIYWKQIPHVVYNRSGNYLYLYLHYYLWRRIPLVYHQMGTRGVKDDFLKNFWTEVKSQPKGEIYKAQYVQIPHLAEEPSFLPLAAIMYLNMEWSQSAGPPKPPYVKSLLEEFLRTNVSLHNQRDDTES